MQLPDPEVRVYECPCGRTPIRPVRGFPKPCDYCDEPLDDKPYRTRKYTEFIRNLMEENR